MKQKFKNLRKEVISLALMGLGIFSFRSSIADHYVVPTGSMRPTILPGDHLVVSKSAYQLRIPFTDIGLNSFKEPTRGDIIVFRYPLDTSIFYVKRLIGLPGDVIEVRDGAISVNGTAFKTKIPDDPQLIQRLREKTGGDIPPKVYLETVNEQDHWVQRVPESGGSYNLKTLTFKVPDHEYFFMGDNRDESSDSRFWGFVKQAYLQGRAFGISYSWDTDADIIPKMRWQRFGRSL